MVVVVLKRAVTGEQVAGGGRGRGWEPLCSCELFHGRRSAAKVQAQETDMNSLLREDVTASSPALGRA